MIFRSRTTTAAIGFMLLVVVGIVLFRARRTARDELSVDPVAAAKTRFEEVRGEGTDLSRGPCLGVIGPGWVADITHDPRQAVDEEPANQCDEFRSGTATHFVELTPDGRLIRVK